MMEKINKTGWIVFTSSVVAMLFMSVLVLLARLARLAGWVLAG